MSNETISDTRGIHMVTMFIGGSTLIIGAAIEAKKDVWLAIITAGVLAMPMLLIYSKILSLFPGKDLFEILELLFGKIAGKLAGILYTWYAFHLGTLVVRNFGEFITTVGLPSTPMSISMGLILFLCLWAAKEGIEVIGRWSGIFVFLLYSIIIITSLLSIPDIKPDNIRPVLDNGIQPVLQAALGTFAFPFAETVLFIAVLPSLKTKRSPFRIYLLGLVSGLSVILAASMRNVLVLGSDLIKSVYFPSYVAVRTISIGDFLQRIEITVAVGLLIGGFVKISVCLLAACKGVARLFGFGDYRFISTPVALLMLCMSIFVYKSIMEMFDFVKIWFYYSLPFQVFIPVIMLVTALIKTRKEKSGQTGA